MQQIPSNPVRPPRFPLGLNLRFSIALSLVAVFLSGSAWAKCEASTLPISFYCFNYAPNLKSIYIKSGKTTFKKVDLSIANIVDGGQASVEDGWLSLYGPEGSDGDYPTIGRLEIKSLKKPLIVLSSATKDGKPSYEAKAIEGDLSNFPMGGFYFVSLLPHPMQIKLADQLIKLGPNETKVVHPQAVAGTVTPVSIEYLRDGNWLLATSARWAYRPDRRTVIGVRLDPRTQRIVVKSIPIRE